MAPPHKLCAHLDFLFSIDRANLYFFSCIQYIYVFTFLTIEYRFTFTFSCIQYKIMLINTFFCFMLYVPEHMVIASAPEIEFGGGFYILLDDQFIWGNCVHIRNLNTEHSLRLIFKMGCNQT
jgi:hypothetical protein